jgi:hypothetical protein
MILQVKIVGHTRDICVRDVDSAKACGQVVFFCSYLDFVARLTCRGRQANRGYTGTEQRGNRSC